MYKVRPLIVAVLSGASCNVLLAYPARELNLRPPFYKNGALTC